MRVDGRLRGVGGLAVAAAAAAMPPAVQLALAGGAIALMGLPHGASDLAVVPARHHSSFLFAYLTAVGGVVLLWLAVPSLGLALLLTLSAVHFALDVPRGADPIAAWGWGLLLVGGPAVLHRTGLAGLFDPLVGSAGTAMQMADFLHGTGLAGLALVGGRWVQRNGPDAEKLTALVALLLLPPLIGFAAGFVLVHAWPQLGERQRELGCAGLVPYLRRTAPVLGGAAVVMVGIALAFATHPSAPMAILFAGIAALATPHMLVTPVWRLLSPAGPSRTEVRDCWGS